MQLTPTNAQEAPAPRDPSWGERNAGWLVPTAVLAGSALTAWMQGREAEKNRDFQERMSNTQHQRQVEDLQKAGLNPALSAMGGSSSPSGDKGDVPDFGEAASRALMARLGIEQARANIVKTRAEAVNTLETAGRTRLESQAIGSGGQISEQRRIANETASLELDQRRRLVDLVVDRMRAEISSMQSATEASKARAALDRFEASGASRKADIEEFLSEFPVALQILGAGLSKVVGGAVGGAAAGAILRKPTTIYNLKQRRP